MGKILSVFLELLSIIAADSREDAYDVEVITAHGQKLKVTVMASSEDAAIEKVKETILPGCDLNSIHRSTIN